jgi:hypothetical protein
MKTFLKTMGVAAALAASTLGMTQAAQAQGRWDRRGGDDAAIAIGAGILGLAVGAALADRDDGYYYDRRYYNNRRYVTVRGGPDYYYYYDGAPRRYYRDRYYGRPNVYRNDYRGGWGRNDGAYRDNRWGRRGDRWDRQDYRGDRGRWDRRDYRR